MIDFIIFMGLLTLILFLAFSLAYVIDKMEQGKEERKKEKESRSLEEK